MCPPKRSILFKNKAVDKWACQNWSPGSCICHWAPSRHERIRLFREWGSKLRLWWTRFRYILWTEHFSSKILDSEDDSDQPSFIAFARGQRLLDLYLNGQKLAPNITIYQAIRECEESGSELSDDEEYQNMIWGRTFTITYKLIPKEVFKRFCPLFCGLKKLFKQQ